MPIGGGVEAERQAEQEFVDLAYARLDAMRSDANSLMEGVLDLGRGGTFQSRTERDVIVRTSLARLEQLDIGDQALTFGRIDRVRDDATGTAAGPVPWRADPESATETFHIGRLAIHSADHDPLVVDWRAPVAEPFYRATGRDPQGLVLRRHLALQGRRVVGVEDERFSPPGFGPGPDEAGSDGGGVHPDGPDADGTGELIVGPNPLFLRYIEQVLPSLGETGVTLSTVSGLVPEVRIRENGPAEVARLKGDARMAAVVARAVRTRQRPRGDDVAIPYGALLLRLTAGDTRRQPEEQGSVGNG